MAQARAEGRRTLAVAAEQENIAHIEENHSKLVEAEAEVPKAIAAAFRDGALGILDYYPPPQRPGRHRHADRHRPCRPGARQGGSVHMTPLAFLFADGSWFGLAIFILFVIFSVLSKATGKLQEAQKEAMRRARTNPPQGPKRASGSLEDEIAEFLRRAVEGPKAGPARPPKSKPPPPLTVQEAVPPQPTAKAGAATVADHVRERFGRAQFDTPSVSTLEPGAGQAEREAKKGRRADFPREVGRLTAGTRETAAPPAVVEAPVPADRLAADPVLNAAAIAALLKNPATLRQTILASEILRRPEERWTR